MSYSNKNTKQLNSIIDTTSIKWMRILLLVGFFFLLSCESFVEIDAPKNLLNRKKVFENTATVESTLANIYTNLRDEGFLSSYVGFNTLMGIYADELEYLQTDLSIIEFQQHAVTSDNRRIKSWWEQAYNGIYAANDILEGLSQSTGIRDVDKESLAGQALFIRSFLHFMLTNVFGDIPYITTTDYIENNVVKREGEKMVYNHIITDLKEAVGYLEPNDLGVERVVPDQTTAKALLARMYLYNENWQEAESLATEVIDAPGYELETDLSKVFLKESSEAIWQFKPDMINDSNSDIPNVFLIRSTSSQRYTFTQNFMDAFDIGDLRKEYWVGQYIDFDTGNIFYFPYKYKEDLNTDESLEYSIVFRLAEQYLIRAEARTHLGRLDEARRDLNKIRNRAGLPDVLANTEIELKDVISHERQVELFTEYGQRWFDLKRTGSARNILSPAKPNWKNTDLHFPVPEDELAKNSNLQPQNEGY